MKSFLETKEYIKELKIPGIRGELNQKVAEAYRDNAPYEEFFERSF